MRLTILAIAALGLAACSGSESAKNGSSGSSAAIEPTPGNVSIDPQNSVVPLGNSTAAPVALTAIPTDFQGRWGMVSADCDPKRDDNKGLLTIAGNRLSFYESRGDAGDIRRTQPTQIAFDLPMSGEGQTWVEPTTLTLLDDGKTLVRKAKGSPDRAGSFRYNRCPA